MSCMLTRKVISRVEFGLNLLQYSKRDRLAVQACSLRDLKWFLNQLETDATSGNLTTPTSGEHGTQPRAFTGHCLDATHSNELVPVHRDPDQQLAQDAPRPAGIHFGAEIMSRTIRTQPWMTARVCLYISTRLIRFNLSFRAYLLNGITSTASFERENIFEGYSHDTFKHIHEYYTIILRGEVHEASLISNRIPGLTT
ncbi:hypothetical protein B0H11DRAFT_1909173 [Mycena galericulata]|nr:hypothetical protein B0H11DRAFT_1909173 [Mycena galericulata]